jgi:hypothetical protein
MVPGAKWTRVALGEEVIPCSLNARLVGGDDLQQFAKRATVVTIIVGHPDGGLESDLRFVAALFDVDVHRFTRRAFVGIEEKSEVTITKDDRHRITVSTVWAYTSIAAA